MNQFSFIYVKTGNEDMLQNEDHIIELDKVTTEDTKILYIKSRYKTKFDCIRSRETFYSHSSAPEIHRHINNFGVGNGIMLMSNSAGSNYTIIKNIFAYLQDINHPHLNSEPSAIKVIETGIGPVSIISLKH